MIVRRETGEGYRDMLTRMAQESGIETPTADELIRLDRRRKGKTLSNAEWKSPTDPDARIAKLKDGRTHLAYKPEHAVDLDTGAIVAAERAIVAAELHPADRGDTAPLPGTLASAAEHLAAVEAAPTPDDPTELVADKGYHSRAGLKALEDGPWKSRIAEPKRDGVLRWHGDDEARRAVYNNRARLLSGPAAVRGGPEGVQAPGRAGGARLRPDPGPRRHAQGLAARPRERPQALPDPRLRV
jgi:transposase